MADLDLLLRYVRSGTAEGDRQFLQNVFIQPTQLSELVNIEPGGMRLLIGNKGSGKSAIAEWLKQIYAKYRITSLLLRPDNLVTKDLNDTQDVGALKRHFYDTLVAAVAAKIGSELKGFLKGAASTLYMEAKSKNLVHQDFVGKIISVISAVSTPVGKIDGVKLAKELAGVGNPNALIRAVQSHLLHSGSIFYLFVDDTDQVASAAAPSHLDRIWALLLAIRQLAGDCPSMRAVVTLRSEIWTRMVSEQHGQRDQTDHLRGSVVWLRGSDSVIGSIVRKRLQAAADDANQRNVDPYSIYFEKGMMTLPTSSDQRSWEGFLVKSSRERPRDAIQLIKNMVDAAKARDPSQNGISLVMGSGDAERAMKVYSKERLDDLSTEFGLECPAIRDVVTTFTSMDFLTSFEDLLAHLRTIPSSVSVVIRGVVLRSQNDGDAIQLLAFLHETGFINPRVIDNREDRQFRHILFHEDPGFVRMSKLAQLKQAGWEVHPAFRTYLLETHSREIAAVLKPESSKSGLRKR